MYPQRIEVNLLMPGDKGGHAGNADAGPDVAHQVEQAGGIAHLFLGN